MKSAKTAFAIEGSGLREIRSTVWAASPFRECEDKWYSHYDQDRRLAPMPKFHGAGQTLDDYLSVVKPELCPAAHAMRFTHSSALWTEAIDLGTGSGKIRLPQILRRRGH